MLSPRVEIGNPLADACQQFIDAHLRLRTGGRRGAFKGNQHHEGRHSSVSDVFRHV